MLYTVEVRRVGADLAASMVEMRTWLDQQGINAAEFDHSSGGPGITFRVAFRQEAEALAFAKAFRGRLNNGENADRIVLWWNIEPPY